MPDTSTVALVRAAKNPLEAMVALAAALDQIESRLAELQTARPGDGWGAWPVVTGELAGNEGAFVRALTEETAAAKAANEEEERRLVAGRYSSERRTEIVQEGDDHAEVVTPKPSPEKLEARRQFERQHLKLSEALQTPDEDPEMWTEAYAKGGPMWLYLANRDLLITYPRDTLAAMVRDVEEDSPQDAAEMGRDVLKFAGESGPGSIAMGTDVMPSGKEIWAQ